MFSRFSSCLIKTDVTCLKISGEHLFAGIGSQLHVFDLKTNQLLQIQTVFDGLRIHGIEINPSQSHLLLHAENELLILKKLSDSPRNYEISHRVQLHDWIMAANWLQYNNLALVTMHNEVEFLNDDLLTLHSSSCSTKCILYCASVQFDTLRQCVVLSGTVFSEILVWRPYFSAAVCHRLKGHDGVLFSIQYLHNYIVSTSDDRSVIVWGIEGSLNDKSSIISLKHKLHGHNARVFRCKVLNNCLLSAGEDGKVCCWNFEGALIKSWNVHQGGCVWSLDSDEKRNIVITGGSDGSILKFSLKSKDISMQLKLAELFGETPKKLVYLRNQSIVISTETGLLLHYMQNHQVNAIGRFKEFASYSLLEVSPCRRKFAVAGYFGDIHIFTLTQNELIHECRFQIPNKKRIFAIHWISCKHLMSCGPEGRVYLWKIAKYRTQSTLLLIGIYILPQCKERWTTAACKLSSFGVVLGDRKGNIHLFALNNQQPSQTIKRAHSHLGITNVYWNENTRILYSLGRNSTMRSFYFTNNDSLTPLTADVLPFSWLAMKHSLENVLLGFRGQDLVVWDNDKRVELFTSCCGGGHRSWDFLLDSFAYIRDKSIQTIKISRPVELISSTHSTEINAMRLISTKGNVLMISGGEDTTMRFILCSENSFKNVATIKSHLSSIRCVEVVVYASSDKISVFSAGGRGQIIFWHLKLSPKGEFVACREAHSLYVPQDAEIRVMDLQYTALLDTNYLFAACSDGCIKVYAINTESIELCHILKYDLRCILKLNILTFSHSTLLISMATDGFLCFWKVEQDISKTEMFFKYKAHQSGINSSDFRLLENDCFLLLSGGDDNRISLIVGEYIAAKSTINILAKYVNAQSHCAQITGAFLSEKYLFTASLDQKLLVFQYNYAHNVLKVEYCASYTSTICDIKGMNVLEFGDCCKIFVYGLGVELIEFCT